MLLELDPGSSAFATPAVSCKLLGLKSPPAEWTRSTPKHDSIPPLAAALSLSGHLLVPASANPLKQKCMSWLSRGKSDSVSLFNGYSLLKRARETWIYFAQIKYLITRLKYYTNNDTLSAKRKIITSVTPAVNKASLNCLLISNLNY